MWTVVKSFKKLEYPQDAWEVTKPNGKVVTFDLSRFLKADPKLKYECIIVNCDYDCKSKGKSKYCPEADLDGRGIKGTFQDKYSSDNSPKLMIHCGSQFLKVIPPYKYYTDHGEIIFYKEKDGICLIKTDKHPDNNTWTSCDNIVRGVAEVGFRLVSCGHQRNECQWREKISDPRRWGGHWFPNGDRIDTDGWEYDEVRYLCTVNDRNCICDGRLYIVKER